MDRPTSLRWNRPTTVLLIVLVAILLAGCSDDTIGTKPASADQPRVTSTTSTLQARHDVAITAVDFGAGAVELTNHGNVSTRLDGLWLCAFPDCHKFKIADPLVPGAVKVVLFPFPVNPGAGELALYSFLEFESPDAIVSYVQWGTTDNVRAPVAEAAGIWDASTTAPRNVPRLAATTPVPLGVEDWQAEDSDGPIIITTTTSTTVAETTTTDPSSTSVAPTVTQPQTTSPPATRPATTAPRATAPPATAAPTTRAPTATAAPQTTAAPTTAAPTTTAVSTTVPSSTGSTSTTATTSTTAATTSTTATTVATTSTTAATTSTTTSTTTTTAAPVITTTTTTTTTAPTITTAAP